ncbi:hypothetical protein [Paraglaciecola mesophila]|nr:hypothetical protein [Paraglaciecola mesophila]
MKNRKNLVLSSLFALVFSQSTFAQEFDLTSMYVTEQIEANLQSMLAEISNTDSSHALHAIATGLEKSLGESQQDVALAQDKRAGNTAQTASLSE